MKTNTNQIDEIVDLVEFSKKGASPPKGKKYRIIVDNATYIVPETMRGKDILQLSGKTPVEKFQLNQKLRGGTVKKIDLNEVVDFTTPGIERFMTIPLDQTEG
jgi:hypothetical protein